MEEREGQSPRPRKTHGPSFDPRLTLRPFNVDVSSLRSGEDDRFEVEFLEEVLSHDPCNEDALMILGHTYTRRGDYEKGLAMDRRLVRLRPADPTAYYNLACSHSLLCQIEDAYAALEKAVALGYSDPVHILKDPDLANLRKDSGFRRFVMRVFRRAAASS